MKIEVLYVPECPSHLPAVKLVRNVLAAQDIVADIHEVLVADENMAVALRFRGSPTIRINDCDVTVELAEPATFGLSCRLYAGSEQLGLPRAELVRRAVLEARDRDQP